VPFVPPARLLAVPMPLRCRDNDHRSRKRAEARYQRDADGRCRKRNQQRGSNGRFTKELTTAAMSFSSLPEAVAFEMRLTEDRRKTWKKPHGGRSKLELTAEDTSPNGGHSAQPQSEADELLAKIRSTCPWEPGKFLGARYGGAYVSMLDIQTVLGTTILDNVEDEDAESTSVSWKNVYRSFCEKYRVKEEALKQHEAEITRIGQTLFPTVWQDVDEEEKRHKQDVRMGRIDLRIGARMRRSLSARMWRSRCEEGRRCAMSWWHMLEVVAVVSSCLDKKDGKDFVKSLSSGWKSAARKSQLIRRTRRNTLQNKTRRS